MSTNAVESMLLDWRSKCVSGEVLWAALAHTYKVGAG